MGLICFNKHKWFSLGCSILFFISSLIYIILGFIFLNDEKTKFNKLKDTGASTNSGPNIERNVEVKQNQNKV